MRGLTGEVSVTCLVYKENKHWEGLSLKLLSEFYARAVVSKILEASRNIRDFPLIGRVVPETGDERIRERFIYSYRLVYRIEERRILFVAVIHGKRLFDSIAEGFEAGT